MAVRMTPLVTILLLACADDGPALTSEDLAASWAPDPSAAVRPPPGLEAAAPDFALAGSEFAVEISGDLGWGERVYVVRGGALGAGSCVPRLGGQCLGVTGAPVLAGSALVGVDGTAVVEITQPAGLAPGAAAAYQAVVVRGWTGAESLLSDAFLVVNGEGGAPFSAEVVGSFLTNPHVPSSAPVGITWNGTHLVIAHSAGSGPFTVVTTAGVLVDTFDPPDLLAPGDPAFDGTNYWVNGEFEDEDWLVSPTGTVLLTRPQPVGVTQHRISRAWDGATLWGAGQDNYAPSLVFQQAADGTLVDGFDSLHDLYGLTWDGTWLWGVAWSGGDPRLVRMSTDGADIDSVPIPGIGSLLQGLAWDGSHFWACRNTGGDDTCYQIAVTD